MRIFVGAASTVVGLVSYALSSSFNHLFGRWTPSKIAAYTLFTSILCLLILFPNAWRHLRVFRYKDHVALLVAISTTVYNFFCDRAAGKGGKPDCFSIISNAAFATASSILSSHIRCGFVDLMYFFLGVLIVQLMQLKLLLGFAGIAFGLFLFVLLSGSDGAPESESGSESEYVVIQDQPPQDVIIEIPSLLSIAAADALDAIIRIDSHSSIGDDAALLVVDSRSDMADSLLGETVETPQESMVTQNDAIARIDSHSSNGDAAALLIVDSRSDMADSLLGETVETPQEGAVTQNDAITQVVLHSSIDDVVEAAETPQEGSVTQAFDDLRRKADDFLVRTSKTSQVVDRILGRTPLEIRTLNKDADWQSAVSDVLHAGMSSVKAREILEIYASRCNALELTTVDSHPVIVSAALCKLNQNNNAENKVSGSICKALERLLSMEMSSLSAQKLSSRHHYLSSMFRLWSKPVEECYNISFDLEDIKEMSKARTRILLGGDWIRKHRARFWRIVDKYQRALSRMVIDFLEDFLEDGVNCVDWFDRPFGRDLLECIECGASDIQAKLKHFFQEPGTRGSISTKEKKKKVPKFAGV